MLVKETFYAVECDICKTKAEDFDGHSFWSDISVTEENAMESEWHKEDDCHYCPDCHSFDDDDKLILKPQS